MNQQLSGALPNAFTAPAPAIECYLAAPERRNGMGLIIFPGGGYRNLAGHEGKDYAEYFADAGLTCFVVTYRLASGGFQHPAMIEDALAAIGTIRGRAAEWGLNPNQIGVMGSSAGGHLAAHSLVAYDRYPSPVSLRPDFGILCYPVITMTGDYCHTGSRTNLVGENPTDALVAQVAVDQLVTKQTPPCFLWHTGEDEPVPVENSMIFASALRAQGVPFELHVYHRGRHGLGLQAEFPWAEDALRWLQQTF